MQIPAKNSGNYSHYGDIVAIKFIKSRQKEARMNVMVGEIIKNDTTVEEKPVTVHMFGPYPRKNLAAAAHKAAWSPRIKTSEGLGNFARLLHKGGVECSCLK